MASEKTYLLLLENGARVVLTASNPTEAGASIAAARLTKAGKAGFVATESGDATELVLVRKFGDPAILWAEARARAARRGAGASNQVAKIIGGRR